VEIWRKTSKIIERDFNIKLFTSKLKHNRMVTLLRNSKTKDKMKKLILMLGVALLAGCVNAQKVNEKDVPEAVKATYQKTNPGVSVKWTKENGNYEAGFENKSGEGSLLIDEKGNILETETEIPISDLPKAVTDYVDKNCNGEKIKEAAKIVNAKGTLTYEAELRGMDYIFDATGKFIKKSKE
jgi:hypothetical protein